MTFRFNIVTHKLDNIFYLLICNIRVLIFFQFHVQSNIAFLKYTRDSFIFLIINFSQIFDYILYYYYIFKTNVSEST